MTARRLWLSLLMFFAGGTLVAAAALAPNPSDAAGVRQGGTLRLSTFSDVDYVDPALARHQFLVADHLRDLRDALRLSRRAGRGGHAGRAGGRPRLSPSRATAGFTRST